LGIQLPLKPLLEIHWIYLAIGLLIGLLMIARGVFDLKRNRQQTAATEPAPVTDTTPPRPIKPKTLKEKRNAWRTPELRFGYRFLVNGLALTLGCVFLAIAKLTGF
jgi:hypothetical protein